MGKHSVHRKEAIAYKVNTSKRWWRWYARIGRLCVEAGVEYRVKRDV